ncbi:MAG: phosphoglucomutase/phosphomannomutase PgmG [Geminicoccaceae bacterium]
MSHQFHPTILREYDIRGIIGETLHVADARAIGQAFGTMMKDQGLSTAAVGYDGRISSPELSDAVVDGLVAAGIGGKTIGMGPTPMLYFAVHHLGVDAGIQITGSHNPPSHNGFKMMFGGKSFYGEQITELGRVAGGAMAEGEGSSEAVEVFDAYIDRLLQDYTADRGLKVVWDAGNGAAGPAAEALAKKLPGEHQVLFAEVDGTFPNHLPDPTVPENLKHLIEAVTGSGADLGIGFDGDGDRIGVVDGKGRILFGDHLIQILAKDLLPKYPGAPIIADVKASKTLFDAIEAMGGKPVMWKTGHSLIKSKMLELKAPLSGEMSGHIFYKDNFYGHDDALYVGVRLLDVLARSDQSVVQMMDAMPVVVNTPEIRIECDDQRKFEVIKEIKARLAETDADVDDLDGVRVTMDGGWWLLRASNTQAVVVARAEAPDEAGLRKLKGEIKSQLDASGVTVPPSL